MRYVDKTKGHVIHFRCPEILNFTESVTDQVSVVWVFGSVWSVRSSFDGIRRKNFRKFRSKMILSYDRESRMLTPLCLRVTGRVSVSRPLNHVSRRHSYFHISIHYNRYEYYYCSRLQMTRECYTVCVMIFEVSVIK